MKKQILFSILLLFLITSVQAISISELPSTISLNCGEAYYNSFSLTGENISVIPKILGSSIGYTMGVTYHPTSKIIFLSFFQTSACSTGSSTFSFEINGVTKSISLEISEDLWNLGTIAVNKGKRIDIGNIAHLGILEISNSRVQYILSGCGTTEQGLLDEGDTLEAVCSNEAVEINLKSSYGDPFNFAEFEVFSSEAGLTLTSSNDTEIVDPSECILGIDTLGATVRRNSVFAFNTINSNSGKYEPNVIVNVLDQNGDLTPISGTSDNTGFFSKRIHEDYSQDLLIKLFKEGCEPTNKVILFEQSYDDYKKAKGEEEGAFQLVLNMSGKFVLGTAISRTVKNALGEVVEGVNVKITKPDLSSFEVPTNTAGTFSFTPDAVGIWKIQGGLDNYESTRLNEIEVFQNKEYLIVVKVNGEEQYEYKKGDRINFELLENNTLVPLTVDATFGGLPLRFVSGISDPVTFTGTSALSIPAKDGYIPMTITLTEKVTNWSDVWMIGGIILGGMVILILVVAIIKKRKGNTPKSQKMEFQLGNGGSG